MSLINLLKATAAGGTPRTRMFDLGLRHSWWCCFYRSSMCVLHSHWFLAPRDRCFPATLSNIFAPRFLGRHVLVLPILMSHIGEACVRVPCSHLRMWAAATMSIGLVRCLSSAFATLSLHTAGGILRSDLLLAVWSIFLSFSFSDMFGRHTIRHGIRTTPGRLYLQFLVFFGQYKLQTLDPVPSHSIPSFDLFSRHVPELYRLSSECLFWNVLKCFTVQFYFDFSAIFHYFGLLYIDF